MKVLFITLCSILVSNVFASKLEDLKKEKVKARLAELGSILELDRLSPEQKKRFEKMLESGEYIAPKKSDKKLTADEKKQLQDYIEKNKEEISKKQVELFKTSKQKPKNISKIIRRKVETKKLLKKYPIFDEHSEI